MPRKVVITGAAGLLGWHAGVHLHARNSSARFNKLPLPHEVVMLNRLQFEDAAILENAVCNADVVLHYAGVNRAADEVLIDANREIAQKLVSACRNKNSAPTVVYANSTHSMADTIYGQSKRAAHEVFERSGLPYVNVIIPHVYGENARPHYNNVTATIIENLINGRETTLNPEGVVELLHAGDVVSQMIECAEEATHADTIRLNGNSMPVTELATTLQQFHTDYVNGVIPALQSSFSVSLFNTYRNKTIKSDWPRFPQIHKDSRGHLFETVKVRASETQCFASLTEPGVTRGDHFHIHKVERFMVLNGEAVIRLRRVLSNEVIEYKVSGAHPSYIDIPTLYTHSIENTGEQPLTTLFWTNEIFDANKPDTYADPVMK